MALLVQQFFGNIFLLSKSVIGYFKTKQRISSNGHKARGKGLSVLSCRATKKTLFMWLSLGGRGDGAGTPQKRRVP